MADSMLFLKPTWASALNETIGDINEILNAHDLL